MKKNLLRFTFVPLSILLFVFVLIFSFTAPEKKLPEINKEETKSVMAGCPTTCDIIFTDCYGGAGCGTPGCSSVWKVPDGGYFYFYAKSVRVNDMAVCYVPAGTPSWTSYSQIGRIMDPAYRPASTHVVTGTSSIGGTFQVTIYPSGSFYFQQTGGTVAGGPSISLSFDYSLL